MGTLKFVYNDTQVDFLPVGNDSLMIITTQMAKTFKKKIKNFTQTESTQNFISECLNNANRRYLNINDVSDLLDSRQKSGTLMHRILALKFAAWLDPEFDSGFTQPSTKLFLVITGKSKKQWLKN
jgi:hypothetical protein